MDSSPLLGLSFMCLAILFSLLSSVTAKPNSLSLNVYYEPQNVDSTKFFKEQLLPVYESGLLNKVNLKLIPFGRAKCEASTEEYKCTCTHGDKECELMHLMSCALHDYRNHANSLDLISCIQGQPNFDQAFTQCVRKLPARDAKWYAKCTHEFRGHYLSWVNGLRTKALGIKLAWLPTLVMADTLNLQAVHNLKSEICRYLPDQPQCKADD